MLTKTIRFVLQLMQDFKNIIFDYGNVIFTLDFKRSQQAWKEIGIGNPEVFYSHKNQDLIFDEFERGRVSAKEFRTFIRKKLDKPDLTDEQIDFAWNRLLVGVPSGNHELLLNLKHKHRTFLLSNINPIHYAFIIRYLEKEFGMKGNESLFEKVYYSHLTGKRKPDAAIFEQVLSENNINPAETLFIDDSPQHIAGAKTLGIQTYLLTAPETIQDLFHKLTPQIPKD